MSLKYKENRPSCFFLAPTTASLAEELIATRKQLDRMKVDEENTEKMLKERDLILEMKMKELQNRGEVQKMLEIEVDRLYRVNQLNSSLCMRKSPMRSLREKKQGRKIEEEHRTQEMEAKNMLEELKDERELRPCGCGFMKCPERQANDLIDELQYEIQMTESRFRS